MGTDDDAGLAVELSGIAKRFPGVIANHDVTLRVRRGSIHAIVGENGAGKSTLMKTLYGMQQPDAGTICVNGVEQHFKSPSDAIAAGIGMVHQHFMLADNFTVLENIILGAEPADHGVISFADARSKISQIAAASGTHVDLDAPVSELGVGQRQRVEILKVLYRGARILILDEPTAVLVPQEVDELFANLHRLVADGSTILFISHKLDEVLAVSDEITVMRAGTTVTTVKPAEVTRSKLGQLMVGSELPSPEGRDSTIGTTVKLRVTGLTVGAPGRRNLVDDVSFQVRSRRGRGHRRCRGERAVRAVPGDPGPRSPSAPARSSTSRPTSPTSRRTSASRGASATSRSTDIAKGLMLSSPIWENALLGREHEPEFLVGTVDRCSRRSPRLHGAHRALRRPHAERDRPGVCALGRQPAEAGGRPRARRPTRPPDRRAPHPRRRRRGAGSDLGRAASCRETRGWRCC